MYSQRPKRRHDEPEEDEMERGSVHRLKALIAYLNSTAGVRALRAAHRDTLIHKQRQYGVLLEEAEREVQRERELIQIKMPELKKTSQVKGDQDNWMIFTSISRAYIEACDRSTVFDAVRTRAEERLESVDSIEVGALTDALSELFCFRSQPHIVGTVVDIVSSFLKNPSLVRTKFLNFMMVGGPGTGKTTLAGIIARVLSRAGMFVEDRVVTAGRAEFIAEYEGQTVARTRNFLINNLDRGVIFVDEAYAITPWNDGKPESYGLEAVTAMVEFMSMFKGLYCIILAGYEREMRRYFLTTNPGLSRRIPFNFVLRDPSPAQLVNVFKRTLLTAQGKRYDGTEAESYFTTDGWRFLHVLVSRCMEGTVETETEEYDGATRRYYFDIPKFVPKYNRMYKLFENKAGSMTNLADECLTVLMTYMGFGDSRTRCALPRNMDARVMRHVIRQRIMNSTLSEAPECLREMDDIMTTLGRL